MKKWIRKSYFLERERTQLNQYVTILENKIKDLQLCSRSTTIEIRNVPAENKESHDDLVSIVSKIASAIGTKIGSNDIRDVYRLPAKTGRTEPLSWNLHAMKQNIQVLPLHVKILYYKTREFAKTNNYNFCWTSNGRIYLRKQPGDKAILVKSEKELSELMPHD
ncbi:hypothetical protein ACJJTC_014351 [Scirpophaga incertulas]